MPGDSLANLVLFPDEEFDDEMLSQPYEPPNDPPYDPRYRKGVIFFLPLFSLRICGRRI